MVSIIEEEARDIFTSILASNAGQEFRVEQTFTISVFNVLWRIVGGKRYEPSDPQLQGYIKVLMIMFKNAFLAEAMPWLKTLAPSLIGYDACLEHNDAMKKMFEEIIAEHKVGFDPNLPPRDFIDAYLSEMSTNPADFNEQDLVGLCMDFFEAGGETVGSTLNWMVLFFALYPEVQEKCYQEVKSVLGVRAPTLDDRSQLPYLDATIMEVQRLGCVAPSGLEHTAQEDTILEGYKIPKGILKGCLI